MEVSWPKEGNRDMFNWGGWGYYHRHNAYSFEVWVYTFMTYIPTI